MKEIKLGQIRIDPEDGEVVEIIDARGDDCSLKVLKSISIYREVGYSWTVHRETALRHFTKLDETYRIKQLMKLYDEGYS